MREKVNLQREKKKYSKNSYTEREETLNLYRENKMYRESKIREE